MKRRDFLHYLLICSSPFVIGCNNGTIPVSTTNTDQSNQDTLNDDTPTSDEVPTRKRGDTVINVRDMGAYGDSIHDDTAAFQKAVDALPVDGGTVYVPDGSYLIDAEKRVTLRSNMHLMLSDGAKVMAKPNDLPRAYIFFADLKTDVEISGGSIIGDRDHHYGTTGEWGYGINIHGCTKVTIRDIHVSKCWGDGLYIGGHKTAFSTDVVLSKVVSSQNRRQGLSIGTVDGMKIYDCEFRETNGTAPECGIDIEPDSPHIARNILIARCLFTGNNKSGLQVYKRVSNVTIQDCDFVANKTCGVVVIGCDNVKITSNRIQDNGLTGVLISTTATSTHISENTFSNNYSKNSNRVRSPFTFVGWSKKVQSDILLQGGGSNFTDPKDYENIVFENSYK